MPMNAVSPGELYLQDFHDRVPGVTRAAFAGLPACIGERRYPSSYAVLVSIAKQASRSAGLLDLACGDGHLLQLVAESGCSGRLVGVDISRGDLAIARCRLPGEVLLLQERAQELSLQSGSVDIVLSHMALMLLDDIETVLGEIRRVLIPGGTLAAVVGRSFLTGEPNMVFQKIFQPFAQAHLTQLRIGDRRTRSVEGWRELLQQAGFDGCRFKDVDVPWQPTPVELWDALTQTYDIDRLSPSIRLELRDQLVRAWAPLQDAHGRLATGWGLRLVHVRACEEPA